jgi:predicted membrane protein
MKTNKKGEIKPLLYSMLLAFFILMILIVVIAKSNSATVGKAFANIYSNSNLNLDWLIQSNAVLYGLIAATLIIVLVGLGYIVHGETKLKKIFQRENKFMVNDEDEKLNDVDETDLSELKNYVKSTFAQGYSKDQIIDSLLASGWQHDEIDNALKDIK